MVQGIAKVQVPSDLLPSALSCFKDKMVINDKYSQ